MGHYVGGAGDDDDDDGDSDRPFALVDHVINT